MNSHTTDSQHQHRQRRRPPRGQSRRPGPQPARQSHRAPALEPIACDTAPVPFTTLELDSRLLEGIRDLGYKETRPVQTAVIPLALSGADVIACAETGTGKTSAFVIPILQRLLTRAAAVPEAAVQIPDTQPASPVPMWQDGTPVSQGFSPGPAGTSRVLILAPTRELAVQIEDEIHGLAYHTPVTSAAIYGGVEMGGQERALKAGVDVIVATPGRLIDHMRQKNAELGGVELLVLDEADRMMDMGFWPDVRRIIAALPSTRQTLLFSATMPDDVTRFALEIVRDPKFVQVGVRSAPAKTITHRAHLVPAAEKLSWLIDHLRRPDGPALIFTRTKVGADRLTRRLVAAGIRAVALHADRTMTERRQAVEGFRGGKYLVLVATDIAARGLDIDGIHSVINFEVPDSSDAYVHRVGRTGRADVAGHALTLVSPDEQRALALLEKAVGVRLELDRDV